MKLRLSLLFLLIIQVPVLAQEPSVLLRVDVQRPIMVFSDPMSDHIYATIQCTENSIPPVCFVQKVYPCHFYGEVFVIDEEMDYKVYEGYIEKTSCYGVLYPDIYVKNEEGASEPIVRLFSQPSKESSFTSIPIGLQNIEAIPLDIVYNEGREFSRVFFIFENEYYEGWVTRLCSQPFTTCN